MTMPPRRVCCTKCKRQFGADLFLNSFFISSKIFQSEGSLLNCPYCDHLSVFMEGGPNSPMRFYYKEIYRGEKPITKLKIISTKFFKNFKVLLNLFN